MKIFSGFPLSQYPYHFILLIIVFLFFLGYPGQNYYQTLQIKWREPEVIPLPKAIAIQPAPYPELLNIYPIPELSARSAILMDIPSAVVMYEKNPQERLFPASTAKIMTALVALDFYPLDEVVTVGNFEKEGAQMKLEKGDQVTVRNILYGMLVNSGNDAATVLASHFPGGEKVFIDQMNKKAEELHLYNTHFINTDGFSEPGQYISARDLARLSTYALQNPFFAQVVSTRLTDVPDASGKKFYHLENVNKLLGVVPGITGIKTGWTEEAGECLVASVERDGKKLVSVILGSKDRFGETAKLMEYGVSNFSWQKVQTP